MKPATAKSSWKHSEMVREPDELAPDSDEVELIPEDTPASKYSFWEKLALEGIIRRAERSGMICSEQDLLNERKLSKVISAEEDRLRDMQYGYAHLLMLPYSIAASIAEFAVALEKKLVGQRFVPAVPAYNDTYLVPVRIGEITFYTEKMRYVEATPDHFEPVYETVVRHPAVLAAAITVPIAVVGVLYARSRWMDVLQRVATEDNLKEYALHKVSSSC